MNKCYTLLSGFIIFFFILGFSLHGVSQEDEYSPEQIKSYKADVQNLVDFLEYSFNMLGNPQTTARDKDVIINESYAKIFMNEDVQVEDDLDDERETLINKDVQAYLKDIDFFFREAVFSLNVSSIDHAFNSSNELYFIVTLTRTLNAKTVTGDSISSNKERFIEVNYDEVAQDLRIASIYTTRIDERDELFAWWNTMPRAWRELIGGEAPIKDTIKLSDVVYIDDTMAVAAYIGMKEEIYDTVLVYGDDSLHVTERDTVESLILDTLLLRKNMSYRMLQRLAGEKEIDISENLNITDLEPLSQMGEIQKLNISGTLVDDLSPLRNLIKLEFLNCSGTAVTSLAPLQYSVSLKELDISTTLIGDVALMGNLRNLEALNISNTPTDSLHMLAGMKSLLDLRLNHTYISDLSPLSNLQELRILQLSYTYVKDLSPVYELKKIERLHISSTPVSSLQALEQMEMLQTIYLDSTNVSDISPLSGLPKLEKVYCDNTGITGSKANRFMEENPGVIVIFESVALSKWWTKLPEAWKEVFRDISELDPDPGKEQLHTLAQITDINISGNSRIRELTPLKTMVYLRSLDCSNTSIDNLWPLSDLFDLRSLNISGTDITNCDPLRDLTGLEYLDLSNTGINDIQCLSRIKKMHELDISHTGVDAINVFGKCSMELIRADMSGVVLEEVIRFKEVNPETTILYQTDDLQLWWNALAGSWKEVFLSAKSIEKDPDAIELQQIVDLTEIDLLKNSRLDNLIPLQKLYRLRSLKMDNTQITDLRPLEGMYSIQSLILSNNPVEDLSPLSGLSQLRQLDFKNTPVDDLEPIASLFQLEILDLAGTQVKKLDDISGLSNLRQLIFYNTRVKSLDPLENLPKLELIKCYNTRIKERKVEKYNEIRPDVEVVFY